MTIDKGIENLEQALADRWCPWSRELKASIQLAIEALKRLQVYRAPGQSDVYRLLPGETEE